MTLSINHPAQQLREKSHRLWKQNNFDESIRAAQESLALAREMGDREELQSLHVLSLAYYARGKLNRRNDSDMRRAEELSREALKIDPDDPDSLKHLSTALLHTGHKPAIREAIQHARRYLELAPDDPIAYGNLARALIKNAAEGDIDVAIDLIKKRIALDPRNSDAYGQFSTAFLRRNQPGDIDSAQEAALKRIHMDPDNAVGYWQLAEAQFQAGNYAYAEETTQEAKYHDPDRIKALVFQMRIAIAKGDMEKTKSLVAETENHFASNGDLDRRSLRLYGMLVKKGIGSYDFYKLALDKSAERGHISSRDWNLLSFPRPLLHSAPIDSHELKTLKNTLIEEERDMGRFK